MKKCALCREATGEIIMIQVAQDVKQPICFRCYAQEVNEIKE